VGLSALLLGGLAVLWLGARPGSAAGRSLDVAQLERVERAAGYGRENRIRIVRISYVAHDGLVRKAYVILPRWYRRSDDPPVPLVISPHGRGVSPLANAVLWGNLPAVGRFAVVCPEGQGRRLALFAWGDPGDIADLARMPAIVERALPFVRIDAHRIYAFGSSMGGQETLLLVARYPRLLAGAAAFDADTNLALRYRMIAALPRGRSLQSKLRDEVGGTPFTDPSGFRARSPLFDARRIAFSGVPLQIWWSVKDRIVRDQSAQSGLLYRRIRRLNPAAPVVQIVGTWAHSVEFHATRRLSIALSAFSLLPTERGPPLDRAAKRALGLPPDWTGRQLAIDRDAGTPRLLARLRLAGGEVSQALAERRALQIYDLMQRYFYLPASHAYAGTYPPAGPGHAQVWPYSQALEATLQVARLPGAGLGALAELPSRLASLAPYRAALAGQLAYAPIYGGKGNVFYDDNVWIGIELIDAARILHDQAALAAAQRVFAWIETGWDATATACPGGVYWLMPGGSYWNHSAANRYRTAVSTATGALLAVLLYERTGLGSDLRWRTSLRVVAALPRHPRRARRRPHRRCREGHNDDP
jgi:hypothetical protein